MKTMHKILLCSLFFLVLAVFTILPASAESELVDPNKLYVAGVPVTQENAHDILGDGTAVYDMKTNTLKLHNFSADTVLRSYMPVSGVTYDNRLSVFCGVPVNVEVTGNCLFKGGIVLEQGNVTVRDANVTFAAGVPVCIDVKFALVIMDSTITLESANSISPVHPQDKAPDVFDCLSLVMTNSKFIFAPKFVSAYPGASFSVFSSDASSIFKNSTFEIKTPYPLFHSTFYSEGGAITFESCKLDLAGQSTCFWANGTKIDGLTLEGGEGEVGMIGFLDTQIEVDHAVNLLRAVSCSVMKDTEIEATLYQNGFILMGEDVEALYVFSGCKVKLKQADRSDVKDGLRKNWKKLSDDLQSEYGDFDQYYKEMIEAPALKGSNEPTFGIICTNGATTFERCRMQFKGFDVGFFTYGETVVQLLEEVSVKLDANRAAFIMLSLSNKSWICEVRQDFGFRRSGMWALPDNTSEELGYYFYTFLERGAEFSLKETEEGIVDVGDVLDNIKGASAFLHIRSEGVLFTRGIILISVLGGLAVVIAVVYFIWIHPHGYQKHKASKKQNKDETSNQISEETETGDQA